MTIRRFFLTMKNMGFYFFVPLVFLYIIIPLLGFVEVKEYGIDNAYSGISMKIEMYIPLLSIWWIIFSIKEYIEGDGNEILYTDSQSYLSIATYIILVYIFYIIHVGILYVGLSFIFNELLLEYVKTAIQCFFFATSTYMLIYLLHSTTFPLMITFAYNILMYFIRDYQFERLSIFSNGTRMDLMLFMDKYIVILFISIVFMIIGMIMNKRYYY